MVYDNENKINECLAGDDLYKNAGIPHSIDILFNFMF